MKKLLILSFLVSMAACVPKTSSPQKDDPSPYLKVNLENLPACSVDSPCASDESCLVYDDTGKAYCYPEGREDEVVGCRDGKLIILNSYPGRVDCI